jgi:putative membrane protein
MPTPAIDLDTGTKLAVERTWLAHERTILAWVRTAASLISFGFTIYKFFELELRGRAEQRFGLIGPREFAMILIAIGIGSLVISFIEHRQGTHLLRDRYGDIIPKSIAGLVAGIVGGLGVLAMVLVVLRQ